MFKVGNFYEKTSKGGHPCNEEYFMPGQIIYVVAKTHSLALGDCYIVENANSDFIPITLDVNPELWRDSNKSDFVNLVKLQSA